MSRRRSPSRTRSWPRRGSRRSTSTESSLSSAKSLAEGLEDAARAYYDWDYEGELPDLTEEVTVALDAAHGNVPHDQFQHLVDQSLELDREAAYAWQQQQVAELSARGQARIAAEEAQRQQQLEEQKAHLHASMSEVAASHGLDLNDPAVASALGTAVQAANPRDETELRQSTDAMIRLTRAQKDATAANMVRAGILGEAPASDKRNWQADNFETLPKIPATQVDPGAIYNQSMLARGDEWLRQQMVTDDILASAAEIDPGLRTQPVNIQEKGSQNRPAAEGRKLAGEQRRGFRR